MIEYFPQLAAVLALAASIVYIKSMRKGESRPHRTTRFVILAIALVTTASLVAQGNSASVLFSAASAIQGGAVFALSLKYGLGGTDRLDIVCLLIALIGIVLWQVTKQPILALYFAIGADFVGGIPMYIKTWKQPHTEIWTYYAFDVVGAVLILIATQARTFENLAYPMYIFLVNALVIAIVVGRGRIMVRVN